MSSVVSSPTLPSAPCRRRGLWAAGKFLREDGKKVFLKGVSYGPFHPNGRGELFPEDDQLKTDLEHIQRLGLNTIRLYELPTQLVLETAARLGLKLLVGIPWMEHVDFISNRALRQEIRRNVVSAVARLKGHDCIAAFLIGNEIEKTLVRWMGPPKVQRFLEELIELGRQEAPGKLFSYATYPSTEYLLPRNADFVASNLYLEQPETLAAYLQRLQNLAGNKPLVITEFGLDVAVHGPEAQREAWGWFHACAQHAGVAGSIWFSYTDEWFRGGREVTDWQFGITDRHRTPRPICEVIQAPAIPTAEAQKQGPKFSIVVCTYNGSATLPACLESLEKLCHDSYEILLMDDGSTQDIAAIAKSFPTVRYVRLPHGGLSVARNEGAALATGEIVAYTDDDCLVDEDWLTHLAVAFEDPSCVAAGGPNIPPPPRNSTEATVAAAPGAPAHVLLNDSDAEHLPGCNLAIRKDLLQSIGGFRSQYRVAGDDVDICWRLRETGGRLRFAPAAMVWHHRRYRIKAYLRQQQGYGRAEALLMKDHPQRFGPLGGARWDGSIYGDLSAAQVPEEGAVFHGAFGNGLFQGIYTQAPRCFLDWISGVLWVAMALVFLAARQPWLAMTITLLAGAAAYCRMRHLPLPPFPLGWRSKCLLFLLCLIQPILRESSRLAGMLRLSARPTWRPHFREVLRPRMPKKWTWPVWQLYYWSDKGVGRDDWLTAFQNVLKEQKQPYRTDDGWRWFDIEVRQQRWFSSAFSAVTEYHGQDRCLTKIRAAVRPSKGVILLMGISAVLNVIYANLLFESFNLFWLLVFLSGVLFLLPMLVHLFVVAFFEGRRSVELAAERCGLVPISRSEALTSSPSPS